MNKILKKYIPSEIEKKWQDIWAEEKIFSLDLDEVTKPFLNLMMFPYPSAEGLHIGNMYAFTGADIHARFNRMRGFDVFEPIGLDGFGIHSENYAMKVNKHPMDLSKVTEKHFYEQLHMIGNSFDWDRTVETYKPEYYRWTQWLFLKMFEKGLAYREKATVNWCPSCLTVLADEQVISDHCERCGTQVEQKELEQWFFKITDYAERLLANLEWLDWSEKVKVAQKNWLGKSEGVIVKFGELEMFTTRPDTLFGVTFLVISPEHPLLKSLTTAEQQPKVEEYVKVAQKKIEQERRENKQKTGVFTGSMVKNPLTGEEVPVWVADYVLMGYGTGAIMAVPAHDERDFEFAKQFDLPIKQVIEPLFIQDYEPGAYRVGEKVVPRDSIIAIVKHWSEDKYIQLNWKEVAWKTLLTGGIEKGQTAETAAIEEIKQETGFLHPKFIKELGVVHGLFYHVPKQENRMVHGHIVYLELEDGEKQDISEEESKTHELKWSTLEELEKSLTPDTHKYSLSAFKEGELVYGGEGVMINSGEYDGKSSSEVREEISNYIEKQYLGQKKTQWHLRDWLISRQRYWGPPIPIIYCDSCGTVAVPEKDLPVELPYVKDFRPTGTGKSPLALSGEFMKVSCPKCGGPARRETDVSDTFLDSAWYFLRYPSTDFNDKPFDKDRTKKWLPVDAYIGGAEHSVLHLLYSRFVTMVLKDLGLIDFEEPFTKFRAHGLVIRNGAKMSKSKGNVVNPDEYIKEYGVDILRGSLMFLGPYDQNADFKDSSVYGIQRFLARSWGLFEKVSDVDVTDKDLSQLNTTVKKLTDDLQDLNYNTAIASLMEWLNYLSRKDEISKEEYKTYLLLLAPFAPHITEELWEMIGEKFSIHQQSWPKVDEKYLLDDKVTVAIQVNGKVRDTLEISSDEVDSQDLIEKKALDSEKVKKFVSGEVKKIIYIKGKIVSIIS